MKRYIRAGVRSVSKKSKHIRLNYNAVDTVMDKLEGIISTLESDYDVDLVLDWGFNNYNEHFYINCGVEEDSQIETRSGNLVKISTYSVKVIRPSTMPSDYGPIDMSTVWCSTNGINFMVLSLSISNSDYDDAEIVIRGRGLNDEDRTLTDISEVIPEIKQNLAAIERGIDKSIESAYSKAVEAKAAYIQEQREKAARRQNRELSKPVTLSNISKAIAELKKNSDSSIVKKGNYLRVTSYEDDFVQYFDLEQVVDELNQDDITIGDLIADPDIMLDCSTIGKSGVHHAFEADDYREFKREMNSKLGFSKQ